MREETDLVQLQTDQAHGQRSSRRNRRDDLARNQLGLVPVRLGNSIVSSTEVGRGGDKVDVVVRVVILFEIDRVETEASEGRGRW